MKVLILIAFVVVILIASLFMVGAQQPSRAISAHERVIFVALKHTDPENVQSHEGLANEALFASTTAYSFVGPNDPYWTNFLLLPSDAAPTADDLAAFDDSYVAEIELVQVPVWLLGTLRMLHKIGITRRPTGPLPSRPEEFGERLDVLPNALALETSKQMDPTAQITMVNFLEYREDEFGDKTLGRQNYGRYGLRALQTVHSVGGQFLFNGKVIKVLKPTSHLPETKDWDDLAAMIYPEPTAVLSMEQDEDYKKVLDDRDEGLESTLVIATIAN